MNDIYFLVNLYLENVRSKKGELNSFVSMKKVSMSETKVGWPLAWYLKEKYFFLMKSSKLKSL